MHTSAQLGQIVFFKRSIETRALTKQVL